MADERYLWPEMLRTIRILKPSFVVGENVAGLVSMDNGKTLDAILADMEDEGYQVESFIIPACAIGAWHRRDRIWIVGRKVVPDSKGKQSYPCDNRKEQRKVSQQKQREFRGMDCEFLSDSIGQRGCSGDSEREYAKDVRELRGSEEYGNRNFISDLGMLVDGLPSGLVRWDREPEGVPRVATGVKDRVNRLKGLGNAIVPQVAFELFKAIEAVDNFVENNTYR